MIRMVDINDYKEYKYHIRPNQSIWFCNSRTERQYMGYAIEDRLKATEYEDIFDGGYTDYFDAMDADGIPVQIKGKSMPYGSTFDDVSQIEMGAMHRLLKTSDIAGRMFTIDLVLHDANLVFIRLKIRVLSERWNEEVSMKMIRLYDQPNVFKGIGNGHEYDGLWKERSLELQELCKEIRAEFRKEHGHDLMFHPLLKRDSKTQKRVQVSVSLQVLLDIADDYEIDDGSYLVSRYSLVS